MPTLPAGIFSRVEELHALGLCSPDTVELLHALNRGGMDLPLTAVTVENHTVLGGLGGAVSEMLAAYPAHPRLRRVGVQDVFTLSGPTSQVKERFGLSAANIARAVLE